MGARRPRAHTQELVVLAYDHASITATFADKLFTAQRAMRIDKIEYVNPTGLAADAVNYIDLFIKKGTTVVGNWSTETGEEGSLAADTIVNFTLSSTDTDLVADAADVISFGGTEGGAVTLPAGRVIIHGRYI